MRGLRQRESSSSELLGFDLVYQLTYLSAVSAAGIPRNQIFSLASKLPCTTAGYFYKVDRLANTMNYQYSESCRLVGEATNQQAIRSLLLRMSSSLSSGEREMDFMNNEAQVQAEVYGNEYERKLETLRKWTDSYIALMVSVALIIVVAAISMMIYSIGTGMVLGMIGVMIAVSALGTYVIYRTAPREIRTLTGPLAEKSQRLSRKLFMILFPGAMALGSVGLAMGASPGWLLVGVGLMMIPIGVVSASLDRAVTRQDGDISAFLRTMGATASAMGATPVEALGRMDLRSINSLSSAVTRLHTMLLARITPLLCWQRFVAETGSELINRGVRVFLDGVRLGGDAEEVSNRAAVLTMKVNFLRAKRKLVSSSFGPLCMMMHVTTVFLLLFIIEIVDGFGRLITNAGLGELATGQGTAAQAGLSFQFENISFLQGMVIPVVIFLSIINGITPKVTDGGYTYTICLYIGITLLTTGFCMIATPMLANVIFDIGPP